MHSYPNGPQGLPNLYLGPSSPDGAQGTDEYNKRNRDGAQRAKSPKKCPEPNSPRDTNSCSVSIEWENLYKATSQLQMEIAQFVSQYIPLPILEYSYYHDLPVLEFLALKPYSPVVIQREIFDQAAIYLKFVVHDYFFFLHVSRGPHSITKTPCMVYHDPVEKITIH